MLKLLRVLDKANGYIHVPSSAANPSLQDMEQQLINQLPDVDELGDIDDVQERWGNKKEAYDEQEKEEWGREWERRGMPSSGPAVNVVRPPEGALRPE